LNPTPNNEQMGLISPLVEIDGNKLIELNEENFCPSMAVFITTHYSNLERKFPDRKIFEITISESTESSQGGKCKYVAKEENAGKIEPKAYFEIIKADLPDANNRIINLNNLPGTTHIFVNNGEAVYGPLAWDKEGDDRICLKIITTPLPGFSEMCGQIYKISLNNANKHTVVAHRSDGDRYLISAINNYIAGVIAIYSLDMRSSSYISHWRNWFNGRQCR
jgi:hypothetical protein